MKALLLNPDRSRRANSFARAAFALAQANARDADPASFVTRDDEAAQFILQRATASVATTTTSGLAAELARQAFRDFLGDLQTYSGAARLIAQAVPASLNGVTAANYPVRTSGRLAPAWVAESSAIPVVSGVFDNVVIGPARKMSHIVVWSRELSKRSDASAIFQTMLREDVAAGLDGAFFADTAGTTAAPAGLLNGVTPTTGYGGGDLEALKADLRALTLTVAADGSGEITFVMAPERAAWLKIFAPEIYANLDVAASAAVPADRVIAVDPLSLLVGVDPAPDLYASEHAAIHMSDVPLPIRTGGVTADPVRSMWQTGSIALRVIHELDFVPRRDGAVAFVNGATW